MYLETYRESGSFKHYGYEPERDREFGTLYCSASAATASDTESKPVRGSGAPEADGNAGPGGRT